MFPCTVYVSLKKQVDVVKTKAPGAITNWTQHVRFIAGSVMKNTQRLIKSIINQLPGCMVWRCLHGFCLSERRRISALENLRLRAVGLRRRSVGPLFLRRVLHHLRGDPCRILLYRLNSYRFCRPFSCEFTQHVFCKPSNSTTSLKTLAADTNGGQEGNAMALAFPMQPTAHEQ